MEPYRRHSTRPVYPFLSPSFSLYTCMRSRHGKVVMCSTCGFADVIHSFSSRSVFHCSCGSAIVPTTTPQLLAALSRGATAATPHRGGASRQVRKRVENPAKRSRCDTYRPENYVCPEKNAPANCVGQTQGSMSSYRVATRMVVTNAREATEDTNITRQGTKIRAYKSGRRPNTPSLGTTTIRGRRLPRATVA